MSAARDSTSRLRAGLNPLLTSLGGFHNQSGTPLSAVSMTSHNALSSGTPLSAIQPYNPQEWIASPASSADRGSHHFTQEAQPSPPPPPPYSPPRSQRPVSMAYETPPANISAARAPAPQRPSPEPAAASQSFAPPPGPAGRGGSRERRFGLPSFGRRRDTSDQAITPPDVHAPPLHSVAAPQAPGVITSSRPHPAHLTLQIPPQRTPNAGAAQNPPSNSQSIAPSSRRAASTGAIETPTSARSRSASQMPWEPGMPIPPPPPGPPPPGSRSQSMTRTSSGSEPIVSPPTRRPPPTGVAALGPVPPTPADWTDNDASNGGTSSREKDPSPNRMSVAESSVTSGSSRDNPESAVSANSSNMGLARTGAVRGEKTLRERRNESRTRGIRHSLDGSLTDIVIPANGDLAQRLSLNRPTPRSARSSGETPHTGEVSSSAEASYHEARAHTPRAPGSATAAGVPGSTPGTPTPPFSPHPLKSHPMAEASGSGHIPPKSLPTPPPQTRASPSSRTRLALESLVPAPLSPSKVITREAAVRQTADQFSRGTVERFRAFAQKEAAAASDAERVKLFAEFVVHESRIRRERYASAIGAMGSEIFDLTRDLFRPMSTRRESIASQASATEFTPQSSEPSRSHRGSMGSVYREMAQASGSNSAPTSAGVPMSPTGPPPSGYQQASNFMPSLSPILSMSVSENYEDGSSRGRPSSRWWEADSNGEPVTTMERSKRESKYMGVPKEAREALQWTDTPECLPGSSKRDSSDEYPPEKQGWHTPRQEQVHTPQPQPHSHFRNSLVGSVATPSAPNTPSPALLDVSRLVTLPPPYPRHHPAVNNSHPELASTRSAVRSISDLTEAEATKGRFAQESQAMRAEAEEAAKQRRQALRGNLQAEIASGNMSYAEAAAIEADSHEAEKAAQKELEKKEFERFQTAVVMPLNELLTSRIARASQLFDELRGRLFVETREPSPNMPQEEGDEQPELLEKLTLLKWIFEAREMLHRAIYDLLSDRNDRYRDMVLTPYRLSGNEEKLASAQAFFAEDAAKRALAFAEEVLRRTQEFRDVVEENVSRGVEVQLSAFWDIAPPLRRLLDKIPAGDLRGFAVQIPAAEFEETPSYVAHPMQYLFSLLLHAEKSTYQFIESQTNLLCLLHEVKEAVATAKAKVMERDGRDAVRIEQVRREEGARLTEDLKEKVRMVQDQWHSALGEGIAGVKQRVGEWLLETGGWDESLEEGGVGSV